jgi:ribosomal protein L2
MGCGNRLLHGSLALELIQSLKLDKFDGKSSQVLGKDQKWTLVKLKSGHLGEILV